MAALTCALDRPGEAPVPPTKGTPVRPILLFLASLLMILPARAADLTMNVGGRDVVVQVRAVGRDIVPADRDTGGQQGPVECSLLYYSLLAKGDIPAASRLATDPVAASESWQQYRERLGVAAFQKEMAAYFTSRNRILGEAAYGDEVMLLVKTSEYMAGQIYRRRAGKAYVVTGRPLSDASRILGKVLGLANEGKLKF